LAKVPEAFDGRSLFEVQQRAKSAVGRAIEWGLSAEVETVVKEAISAYGRPAPTEPE